MTTSIRRDFHTDLASTVAADIQYKRSNYYYFLGKVEPWGGSDVAPTTAELDSDYENTKIRANALFIKKITAGDISFVTRRIDWATGTIYAVWDHTKSMRLENFYVVTSTKDVYKCLSNNGGVASTVQPSDKSYVITTTADGYIWKYMYSIPAFKESKFMSTNFVPVQKSLSDNFYSRGAVDFVTIVAPGANYTAGTATTINITGATTGTGAAATIVTGTAGMISSVTLTNGGTGYTKGVRMAINTTSGTGAVLTPNIASGVITSVTVTSPGAGYATSETITFSVGGAIITPSVDSAGTIQKLTIVDSGYGYTGTVACTVVSATGAGLYGNANAIVGALTYNGKIVQTSITDPGINYATQTATTITVQGDGTGAVFRPVISAGKLVDVIVENAGANYTTMKLTVVGSGSGASVTPVLTTSDYTSTQSIVEQTTVVGAIYHINVTTQGNNYSPSTTVAIVGDGTGATATATILNGSISKITVTAYGTGYTYGNIVITDPLRTLVGTVVDCVAYPSLPPLKGHGYDAVGELFGETLAINSSLRQESTLNALLQDYRQFGIIKNPTNAYTDNLFTTSQSLVVYQVQFSGVSGLIVDEVVKLGNSRFRVAGISGNFVSLQALGTKLISPIGTLVAETNENRTYSSVRIVSSPSVNKYSGKLLYVSDENPFSFTVEQGIVIKTFLKF